MSRRKVIYFLSAFVLIIGCYALNLSYSLFTQNVATDDIVDSTIPPLEASISVESITIEAGKEYLVKQTITNNSLVPINYSISSDNLDKVSIATNSSIEDNTLTGIVSASTNKDIFLVISNNCDTCTTDINVNFDFKYNYTTINDETIVTNITNKKEIEIPTIPYSDKPGTLSYHIINNFVNSDIYTGSAGGDLSGMFSNGINKVEFPLSGFSVPSPTTFTSVEENEVGLYAAEDDYGTSYYFRGASSMNYVDFAGFTWRIVRINGDGSVRLILDLIGDIICIEYDEERDTCMDHLTLFEQFSGSIIDNSGVGYMNSKEDEGIFSTNYNDAHQNLYKSRIQTSIDTFYEMFVIDYQNYLADTMFCGDKTRAEGYTTVGFGNQTTYYSAYDRIWKNSLVTPTLECASSENDTDTLTESQRAYSRYTSKIDSNTTTSKGVLVNNDLTYPIGLLSADELVMAGAFKEYSNTSYYLSSDIEGNVLDYAWWTMTPSCFDVDSVYEFSSATSNSLFNGNGDLVVRPVINLRADVLVDTGDGTSGSPYTVKVG